MIIPKHNGRIMKEVKKYPNFILLEDQKKKVKKLKIYYWKMVFKILNQNI